MAESEPESFGFFGDRTMKNPSILLVFAGLCCAAATAWAGEMTAQCPTRIPSASIKPDEPVKGFITTTQQMHLLSAGMMMGGPETHDYVQPDTATDQRQVFKFDRGDGQRWLYCFYGGVELTKRLDDRATLCTLTTRTMKPENNLSASVVCKY